MNRTTRRTSLALALAAGIVGYTITAADAHTPNITASCDGIHVGGTDYNTGHGPAGNTWSVTEAGKVVDSGTFGATLDVTVPVPQDGATTAWSAHIGAWDDPQATHGWTITQNGTVGPCGTPPPPPPPREKVAHLRIGTFQSCQASERIVYVKHRSAGIAQVTRSHGVHRFHWTVRAHTRPGYMIHRHRDGTGPLTTHIRWSVRLQHLGRCGHHHPTSG